MHTLLQVGRIVDRAKQAAEARKDSLDAILANVPHTAAQWLGILYNVGMVVLAAAVVWWLVGFVATRFERLAARAAARHGQGIHVQEQRALTVSQLLRNAGHTVVLILAFFGVLGKLGMDITPLIASAGVIGLAISFGSQNLVKDYVTGFFLQVEHQFDIGDVLRIGSYEGVVEDVTLRLLYLRDSSGTLHIIPNGSIVQLSNLSRSWARAVVDVDVAWNEVDRAQELLARAGQDMSREVEWAGSFQEPPEVAGVEKLAAGAVTVRLTARVDPKRRDAVERELRRRVLRALEALRHE